MAMGINQQWALKLGYSSGPRLGTRSWSQLRAGQWGLEVAGLNSGKAMGTLALAAAEAASLTVASQNSCTLLLYKTDFF